MGSNLQSLEIRHDVTRNELYYKGSIQGSILSSVNKYVI